MVIRLDQLARSTHDLLNTRAAAIADRKAGPFACTPAVAGVRGGVWMWLRHRAFHASGLRSTRALDRQRPNLLFS